MKHIDFIKISLIALLLSLLFIAFGFLGLFYDAFCEAIVIGCYYAVCFGMGFLCFVVAIVSLYVELLIE